MKPSILICFLILTTTTNAQNTKKTNVYCLHGQGSDTRLFTHFRLDTTIFRVHLIALPMPEYSDNMAQFAAKVLPQIDTTEAFILVGMSLGGMVAVEINEQIRAKKVVLVSSAKSAKEIPFRYRFMHFLPVYALIPSIFYKLGAQIIQPIIEPDRRRQAAIFNAMLLDKKPQFLKRSTRLIVNWKRTKSADNIIQIHGTKDHTLPIKNKQPDYTILNGSHMMMLTEGEKISALINQILLNK
jgi:pimeloyl-ACP methyl ester carboxylesterase